MSALASERYSDRIATGPLILVQEVLNTRAAGKPALEDLLSMPETAASWLSIALGEWSRRSGSQAPAIEVDEPGLVRLQQLRASLQMAVAGAVRDAPVRPAPKGVSGALDVRIDADGAFSLAPRGKDTSWVVAAALNEIANAQLLGTWRRLKMCRNRNCSVAFYDGTNNNNGVWHDVRICGNAVNLRASRQRRAAAGA
ncbi:CGNR zinc finger domain-containing protein [Streptomyces sp. P17]|uniref:CGNR zinc finger domain-containing protein n=1 Tax=Streptomyces sp. P17 TaxID=3074716 RepID=UPI0028F3E4FE|nr:CGNR zinc finger domain-containing protein [Streptomyces sp. P17]MDT9700253.1 CGNR zinc finger domain-containing protein [Streptomyces sp. P17]